MRASKSPSQFLPLDFVAKKNVGNVGEARGRAHTVSAKTFSLFVYLALIYHRDTIIMIIILLSLVRLLIFRLPKIPWHTNVRASRRRQMLRK